MEADFGKYSHLREKGGLYGQNLPYKFKKLYGDLDYIELLVTGQIWYQIRDPGQILV